MHRLTNILRFSELGGIKSLLSMPDKENKHINEYNQQQYYNCCIRILSIALVVLLEYIGMIC